MIGVLLATVLVCIATIFVQGFGIVAITSIASTLLFCARKIGYFCKIGSIVAWEVIGLLLSLVVSLMFKNLDLGRLIFVALLRCVHIGICYYDMTAYVYVKEIVQKDTKED